MNPSRARRWLLGAILVAAAVAVAGSGLSVLDLRHFVETAGAPSPWIFIVVYAAATVVFVPGAALTIAAGAMFGPLLGTFTSLTGATLGATFAFLIARFLAGEWVAQKAGSRLAHFIRGVDAEGWRFVAFVRLVPLFPFNLLNYALGLTRIPLSQYVVTSYVCMLPGAFAYTYLGYVGREAFVGGEQLMQQGLIGLALLASAALLPRLVMRFRRPQLAFVGAEIVSREVDQAKPRMIVDVRTAEEYGAGHIAGSINMPVGDFSAAMKKLDASRIDRIILVCRTDKRSAKAAKLLVGSGHTDVLILEGGMEEWVRKGLPLAR